MREIIKIGVPGKFDKEFGIICADIPIFGMATYHIVWLATGLRVDDTPEFINPIMAEMFVKDNRQQWIDKKFEKLFLSNE